MEPLVSSSACSVVAIEEVPHDEVEKYGVIAGSELEDGVYVISKMVEKTKPDDAPSNLAIIGRYILTPDIFDIIRATAPGKGGEIQQPLVHDGDGDRGTAAGRDLHRHLELLSWSQLRRRLDLDLEPGRLLLGLHRSAEA